ncbi:serine-rich adhesin for platelets-like isoform X5 [Dermacentor albipictus]|uniref:serine-rich adhesin for platelets-like isoform X5 n=1 Tax=Dermacentor albipictus TaxID=60249 RepID=UPI0038FD0372
MAEKCNNGNTPPAFTFDGEETPSTSQEFFEGTSCTSDCSTMTSDDFFEDLWNAFKSLSYSEDVTGHTCVTESGISSSPPMASSSSSSHPQPSTSHAGREETSAIPENIASISNEALRYQRNTQHMPTTDEICNVDGISDNGSTSRQHLGSVSAIDNARPSTSRAGIEEASANLEDGATNATGTGGMEEQGFCGVRASVQSSAKKLKHKCQTCAFLRTPGSTSGTHSPRR